MRNSSSGSVFENWNARQRITNGAEPQVQRRLTAREGEPVAFPRQREVEAVVDRGLLKEGAGDRRQGDGHGQSTPSIGQRQHCG